MQTLQELFKTDSAVSTLLLRLTLGAVFFPHGAQKALGWFGGYGFTGTMGFLTGTLHIPALFAFLAIAAEFAGSIALILGLGTRIAALGIASTMAVANCHGACPVWFLHELGRRKTARAMSTICLPSASRWR